MANCNYCGRLLKEGKNPTECYKCICVETLFDKGVNAPSSKTVEALRHIDQNGLALVDTIQLSRCQNANR